jgi:hypothetical protein
MPTAKLTQTIIEAAIAGFEVQKKDIDAQLTELRSMLKGASDGPTEEAPAKTTRRKFSAATRKKMKEAQQLRWAKVRGETETAEAKPKRKMSAAGRKAIGDAVRKRWAAKKAESGESAPETKAATKKGARKKAA